MGDRVEITIRRATASDAAAIAEVFLAARRSILGIVPMVHSDADTRQWIAEVLPLSATLCIAERDGCVAAMMALSPGWLEHLYVHPQFHGGGIGSALLAVAKASAEARNGLSLWTFQGNAGARRFYERHGFEAVELTEGTGNEEQTPDVRYVWHG